MRRLRALPVILCLSFPAAAQEGGGQISEPLRIAPEPDQWIVRGIAANDLLNVREKPSPLGKTLGRLPNGSLVRLGECEEVEGYEWCRIVALDVDELEGWTPARYLQSLAEFGAEMERQAAAPADAEGNQAEPAAPETARAADGTPVPQPAPRDEAAVASEPVEVGEPAGEPPVTAEAAAAETAVPDSDAPTEAAASEAPAGEAEAAQADRESRLAGEERALPPGLEARFAGAEPAPLAEAPADGAEAAEPASEPRASAVAGDEQEDDAEGSGAADEAVAAGEADGVPMPSPRPGSGEAADAAPGPPPADSGQVALAEETAATGLPPRAGPGDIAGEAPCARHVGQPMTRCVLLVARTGAGDADVTVVWPDGGTRLIEFRGGAPARSDATGEFRYTREGTLNMIRIGGSERFEILDALAFGG